jgi:uncharacterized protein with HEPN domain
VMEDRDYLRHIRRAIREIKAHTAGLTLSDYEGDSKTERAVERNLQIFGDAVHKLSDAFIRANPDVEWEQIYAARNVVVHFYFGVNNKIVWDILQEDLPPLMAKVEALLAGDDDAT